MSLETECSSTLTVKIVSTLEFAKYALDFLQYAQGRSRLN